MADKIPFTRLTVDERPDVIEFLVDEYVARYPEEFQKWVLAEKMDKRDPDSLVDVQHLAHGLIQEYCRLDDPVAMVSIWIAMRGVVVRRTGA